MRTAIVVFAHGSSVPAANETVRVVAARLAQAGGYDYVEPAFLEQCAPDLQEAVRSLVERGATRILIIPYFLTLGIHLQRDLPRIVEELRGIYDHVRIDVTPPLDGHPALLEILLDRAAEGLEGRGI